MLEPRTFPDGRDGSVSGIVAYADKLIPGTAPVVVLAHGAGNDMSNPFLSRVHEGLAAHDFVAIKFNFPYMERGGGGPDRAPILEACFRAVLDSVRSELQPPALVIGGKSLGGRMASHLAAQGEKVDGLVFLGYPLHPPRKTEQLRTRHLGQITAPMLFFAGTRDSLCDLDLLRNTIAILNAPTTLHVIPDGDHSFQVLKRTGRPHDAVLEEIIVTTVNWLRTTLRA